jgi:hypothetical protein
MSTQGRGADFIVQMTLVADQRHYYVAWAQPAVLELTPFVSEAWRYASRKAATQSVLIALGSAAKRYEIAVLPARS